MTVPYAFANLSGNIALAKLDSNFNTPITIGNTSVLLGNTITTLNNVTLANVTITSATAANVTLTTPLGVSSGGTGLANTGNSGNVLTSIGGVWVSNAVVASASAGGSNTQVQYNNSGVLAGSANLVFDGSNLLIGGSTQYGAAKLTITSGGAYIALNSTTGGYNLVRGFDNGTERWSIGQAGFGGTDGVAFYTGASTTERMRLDFSGNLLVGTTVGAVNNPDQGIVVLQNSGGSLTATGHLSGTSSGTQYNIFLYNRTQIGSITQNGTTGVLYNLTSDYRLKHDQQPLTGAKEFVMALQPKKWKWWDGSGEGVGFIAHEFMEVAKHSGHGEKDAVETIEIKDEDGNITGTEERPIYQSIQPSSSEVMANLVSLIQEQQAMIQSLTDRIAQLEAK